MYVPFKLGEKEFLLKPYTSKQEKDLLLLSSFGVHDFERVFEVLDFKSDYPLEELSDNEKKVILYKLRDISLGDEVDVKYTCDNCKTTNECTIEASNFIIPSLRDDEDISKLNIPVTDETLHQFVHSIDVDELDIQEFEDLKSRVKDNQIDFDFIKSAKCLKCGHEKQFEMSKLEYILEIMSDDTLMTLYKTYNNLVYFGHYTKEDVDNMMPFERSIFMGLLSKTKEDLSQ